MFVVPPNLLGADIIIAPHLTVARVKSQVCRLACGNRGHWKWGLTGRDTDKDRRRRKCCGVFARRESFASLAMAAHPGKVTGDDTVPSGCRLTLHWDGRTQPWSLWRNSTLLPEPSFFTQLVIRGANDILVRPRLRSGSTAFPNASGSLLGDRGFESLPLHHFRGTVQPGRARAWGAEAGSSILPAPTSFMLGWLWFAVV